MHPPPHMSLTCILLLMREVKETLSIENLSAELREVKEYVQCQKRPTTVSKDTAEFWEYVTPYVYICVYRMCVAAVHLELSTKRNTQLSV